MHKLWHKDYGYFETNNLTQVDRKIALGYCFVDEIPKNENIQLFASGKKGNKTQKVNIDDTNCKDINS